jgi:hypothetical protein
MRLIFVTLSCVLIGLGNLALAQGCPANSHKSGSGCICDSGYANKGGQCVPK